jgi:hypothetical protein
MVTKRERLYWQSWLCVAVNVALLAVLVTLRSRGVI